MCCHDLEIAFETHPFLRNFFPSITDSTMIHVREVAVRMELATQALNVRPKEVSTGAHVHQVMVSVVYVSN